VSYGVLERGNGDYVTVGSTTGFSVGDEDSLLVYHNASGSPLWSSRFGGEGEDVGLDVGEEPELDESQKQENQ
jgi:hypothetical protein